MALIYIYISGVVGSTLKEAQTIYDEKYLTVVHLMFLCVTDYHTNTEKPH